MTQEILISLVEIIMILILSFDRAANIRAATPEWVRIPTPTIETLAMFSVNCTSRAPISRAILRAISTAFLASPFGTVKEISVIPSWLTFCRIMSTRIPAWAMAPNNRAAIPG